MASSRYRPYYALRNGGLSLAVMGMLMGPLAGCYQYQAANVTTLRAGGIVRLQFTDAGSERMLSDAGVRLRSLDGTVQQPLGDTALIVMPSEIVTMDGDKLPWRRGALTVPLRALARSDARALDRRRTNWLVAATGVVFSVVVYTALKSIGSGGGRSSQPSPGAPE